MYNKIQECHDVALLFCIFAVENTNKKGVKHERILQTLQLRFERI